MNGVGLRHHLSSPTGLNSQGSFQPALPEDGDHFGPSSFDWRFCMRFRSIWWWLGNSNRRGQPLGR
ncbi:hypothetical protein A2U01_0025831, partial [Trifolium medium]|nr:hypothetical protein [Trifolium medium]